MVEVPGVVVAVAGENAGEGDTVMTNSVHDRRDHRLWLAAGLAATLTLAPLQGAAAADAPEQRRFTSPNDAVKALVEAAKTDDTTRLLAIFGPGSEDLISSGDPVADATERRKFAERAKERTKLEPARAGMLVLHIGREDWPLSIPLVRDGDTWRFDTAVGKEELINRRIGHNELRTIDVMRAYVDAQREFVRQDRGAGVREYARKFTSSEGKHDGLYWPAADGEPESPMGPLVAEASTEGYALAEKSPEPRPYHGYLFRILDAQGAHAPEGAKSYVKGGHVTGGFALVAYPAEYGASGVMTFIVNRQGIVFQKNLGTQTAEAGKAMTAYDPDETWDPVPGP